MIDHFQKLKSMTAADSEPKLSSDEISTLLSSFAVADSDGRQPSDPEWSPTYRIKAAAAEGWRWKAAKAADFISSDLDGDRMSANQVFEHCREMIRVYSRGTAAVSTAAYNCND